MTETHNHGSESAEELARVRRRVADLEVALDARQQAEEHRSVHRQFAEMCINT